jgi:hypothetical protein
MMISHIPPSNAENADSVSFLLTDIVSPSFDQQAEKRGFVADKFHRKYLYLNKPTETSFGSNKHPYTKGILEL